MTAWQASPVRGELWWRRADGGKPVLCYVTTQPLGAMGAHAIDRAIWYSTAPCDGVQWARCDPPTESVGDRFRAAGERAHIADLEREVLRLRAEAEARAEGDAEVTALRARVEALETAAHAALGWVGNCPLTPEGGTTMVAARRALLNAMQGGER